MKKILSITLILLITSAAIFAAPISSGIVVLPVGASPINENTSLFVEAKVSSLEQGLVLKYGDSPTTATLVDDVITKSASEAWEVFGNEETKNFYFFGTGRAANAKSLLITATPTTFQNGAVDTAVQPTITGYLAPGWTVAIAAANPIGGNYTGTTFTVAWDGTTSPNISSIAAGTYTTEITLNVVNN